MIHLTNGVIPGSVGLLGVNDSFPYNAETIFNAVDPVWDASEVALAHRLHVRGVRLVVGADHLVVEKR